MSISSVVRLSLFSIVITCAASAQESINYASVSGRVTDPSGAVVEGAQVTARQTDTNLTNAVDDRPRRTVSIPVPQGRAV